MNINWPKAIPSSKHWPAVIRKINSADMQQASQTKPEAVEDADGI